MARQRAKHWYWLDHARITEDDRSWLGDVRQLTLWNVEIPNGFLASLPHLWWVDIRGGSATDLEVIRGATGLQYLRVNQIRGMTDLSLIQDLRSLRLLQLYGLSKVTQIPALSGLDQLERADAGQMTGLQSLAGVLDAPNLRELFLLRKLQVSPDDQERILQHPSLKFFNWMAEDVPVKVWEPVCNRITLPKAISCHPEDWFEKHTTGTRVTFD